MKLIAVDLEMNQPSGKIIQVGAVCFEPQGKLIDYVVGYVDPHEPISPKIVELTGITDDMISNGAVTLTIEAAAILLNCFKRDHDANSIGVVWGAGLTNDIRELYSQAGIESPFMSRVIDVKGVYQMLANSMNARMRSKVGLEKACDNVGIGFDRKFGAPHNALSDAYNTARLYCWLSKCLTGGADIKMDNGADILALTSHG